MYSRKLMTWTRHDCVVRGRSSRETWPNFWVEYLVATLYIPLENFQVIIYISWKLSQKYTKKKCGFFSCNLENYSQIPIIKMESKAAYFLLLTGLFNQCIKCVKLFAINPVGTSLHPPYVLVSAQTVPITHQCLLVVEQQVLIWGWDRLLRREQPLPWWHRTRGNHRTGWTRPCVGHGPWVGGAWLKVFSNHYITAPSSSFFIHSHLGCTH